MYIIAEINTGACFKLSVPWRMDQPSEYLDDCIIFKVRNSHETELIYGQIKKTVSVISETRSNNLKNHIVR